MRKRLTLRRESLSELTFTDLSAVVGAARTGEWSCDVSVPLVTPVIEAVFGGGSPTTGDCATSIGGCTTIG